MPAEDGLHAAGEHLGVLELVGEQAGLLLEQPADLARRMRGEWPAARAQRRPWPPRVAAIAHQHQEGLATPHAPVDALQGQGLEGGRPGGPLEMPAVGPSQREAEPRLLVLGCSGRHRRATLRHRAADHRAPSARWQVRRRTAFSREDEDSSSRQALHDAQREDLDQQRGRAPLSGLRSARDARITKPAHA